MDKPPDRNNAVPGQSDQLNKKSKRVVRHDHSTNKTNKDSTDIEDLSNHFRQLQVKPTAGDAPRTNISYEIEPLSMGRAGMDNIINMVGRQQETHERTQEFRQQELNPRKRKVSLESEEENEVLETSTKKQKQEEIHAKTQKIPQQELKPRKRKISLESERENEALETSTKRRKQEKSNLVKENS